MGLGFVAVLHLETRSPKREPRIKGIQDYVAAFGPIELFHKFAVRIVDDGDFAPCLDLMKKSALEVLFPAPISPIMRPF